jgi:hypothetical protein
LATRIAHDEFHVRLAGTEPDLADEHVMHRDCIFAGDDEIGGLGGRRQRIEVNNPVAVAGGRRTGGLAVKSDGDGLAGIGAAPDRDRLVALEHGMIGKKRGKRNVGADDSGEKNKKQRGK